MHLINTNIRIFLQQFRTLNFIRPRYIHSSFVSMEKALENLEKNPYFEKYSQKISKLQKTSPEEFLSRAEKALNVNAVNQRHDGFARKADKGKSSIPSGAFAFAPQKKLDSVMKTELLKDRSPEEIKYIWTQHFITKDAISGVMSSELYTKIQDRGSQFPQFLFPLPRDQGYEFIYCQFVANEVHLTPLINYQAYQENAPECLSIVHYPDLQEEKGIVLMHGEFNKDVITGKEAQFLANEITLYYGKDDEEKLELLRRFHTSPNSFRHTDLIDQLEKIDLGALTGSKKS